MGGPSIFAMVYLRGRIAPIHRYRCDWANS